MSNPPGRARTYLFVPGSRPERFAKALASGADAVVLDLEDAVAPDDKVRARDAVTAWLAAASTQDRARAAIRINDAGSPWFAGDLDALHRAGATQIMLPKTESAAQVESVVAALPGAGLLALVESARGVAFVNGIAAAAGVTRLVFSTLDYALDLDLDVTRDDVGLAYAASRIAVASRMAGLATPVAGVTARLDDEARLLDDLARARCFGFGAKLCIHPRQVAAVHQALAPSAESVDWARRVLAAEAASPGAARLDGRMVDRPIVLQAQRILDLSAR